MSLKIRVANHLWEKDDDGYLRGGGHLSTCTAGFTLRNQNGNKFISTAGHKKCAKQSSTHTYSNHGNETGSTTVSRVSYHIGEWGDVAKFNTGTGNLIPTRTFYYSEKGKRYATAALNPIKGMDVCSYGKTKKRVCSKVYKLNTVRGTKKG